MFSRVIDEEKAQGGLGVFRDKSGNTQVVPVSPKSIGDSTLVGSASVCSKDNPNPSPDGNEGKESLWSRLLTALRLRRRSQATSSSNPEDEGDDSDSDSDSDSEAPTTVRKIHKQPNGYPKLATFMDADENFMLYRRFGYLQTRLLLDKQDGLSKLELKLDSLETKEHETSPGTLRSRHGSSPEKRELLSEIEVNWNQYCKLLTNAAAMTALNKPTAGEHRSVANFVWDVEPLRSAEARWLRCREDLVTLRPGREHAWLDSGVEHVLKWLPPLRRAFQSRDTRAKTDGRTGTVLYTRSRIENFVVVIITVMILALLVLPIWVLYRLSDVEGGDNGDVSLRCIGVLLVSTLAFAASISLFTRARRHEILGASAAYVAVLVVFIGNIGRV